MLSKRCKAFLFVSVLTVTVAGTFRLLRETLPWGEDRVRVDLSAFPVPGVAVKDTSRHQLSVSHYRQVGPEIHLFIYTSSAGIAPFSAVIRQESKEWSIPAIPDRPGSWLCLRADSLASGPFSLTLKSLTDPICKVTVDLYFDRDQMSALADTSLWFRHGSYDEMLDVRVEKKAGKYFLKDFAAYHDGRSRTYLLEGMIVDSLDYGVEVRPGYHYTVVARWVDGAYSQWWNKNKYRTSRLQSVWIAPDTVRKAGGLGRKLSPIPIPDWFRPSRTFNPDFDRTFPPFKVADNKLVMMYRLNQDVGADEYFKRGVTHLPRWEQEVPAARQHWTEAPGFFGDRGEDWFSGLTKEETESWADRVGNIGVYAFDFEFWKREYRPEIKQRLLWFSRRLRENNPAVFLFDYWGGSAYMNTTFQDNQGYFNPSGFLQDYKRPRSNHFNFTANKEGDHFGRYFNVTSVDVYPRPSLLTGNRHFNLNNYLILSAIHASRINRMIDFQRNNKTIWFAWNRFMPLYDDPSFPWHVETTSPQGSLVFNGLETIPASQALALSVFSLVEGDGFYLWSDAQPWGRGADQYLVSDNELRSHTRWWPQDGVSKASGFSLVEGVRESPRYWDYPSDFFALGNWMAHQAGDILAGGEKQDLAFFENGNWQYPEKEQAVLAAHLQQPFVTSVRKGNKILVLALDSFQAPNQASNLRVRLPDGSETEIEMYGNWPALYTGTL